MSALVLVGCLAGTIRPAAEATYEARRDEYRQTLTARDKRGENVVAANDSALRALDSLLRPIVGDFSTPWVAGRGHINLEALTPGDESSGLADGMLYHSRDSSIQVLVTTPDLLRSWIAWAFDGDTTVSRDPTLALGNGDVLTQIFDVDAHVFLYADIPTDAPLGVISAKLVARSQDDARGPADEVFISVARGKRIFILDTSARDTLPIPPTCRALMDSGSARGKALVDSAFRAALSDTSLLTTMFRDDELTNSRFRQCYGEAVVHEPRFQKLVDQVRRLVESLPAR